MKKFWTILLIVAGLLPIVRWSQEGVSSILIFSLFVVIFLWKGLQRAAAKIPLKLPSIFIIYGTLTGGLTQLLVQLEGFEKSFSPNPVVHFFQALTIYFCVIIVWYLVLKKYSFSTWGVFWVTGIWGVLVEAIILYGTFNPLVWAFIFIVYGSFASIPYLLTGELFSGIERKKPTPKRYLIIFLLLVLALLMAQMLIYIMAAVGIK